MVQEKLNFLVHAPRMVIDKRILPTKVEISEHFGDQLVAHVVDEEVAVQAEER